MFDIFRLGGDLAHVMAIYFLLKKVIGSKSVAGISLKTQVLYMVVYVTRYLDILYMSWPSKYNLVMKFVYLGSTGYTIYLMMESFKTTRNPQIDTFRADFLIGGAFVMALVFHSMFTIPELLWSFSVWLECVAILPQLFMLQRTGGAESLTVHYIFALGAYRFLYLVHWVYQLVMNKNIDYILMCAGLIQTLLYSDFFYVYYTRVMQGQSFELPV